MTMNKREHEAELRDRLREARPRSWNVTITDQEPVVVEVADETNDRTHTVWPWKRQCSCTDQGDTDVFCDHLLVLLGHDGYAGALTREYFKEHRNTLFKRSDRADSEGVPIEIDRIVAALNVVDADHAMARTVVDATTLLGTMGDDDGDTDGREPERQPTPDEDLIAYEEMVKRIRVDTADPTLSDE